MDVKDEELVKLKTLYDELWRDAKAMIKDMSNSISIYLYSGFVTLLVLIPSIISAAAYSMSIISGNTNLMNWFFALIETVGSIVIGFFSIKLLRHYFRLKKRYSRLLQMEKEIED